jgi:hypothetical protein
MPRNHTHITGPKIRPTLPVPRHCTANRITITRAEIGNTYCCRPGAETSSPSTAESTEIAGVITPSPKNRQAPAMPISPIARRVPAPDETRWASAISARMPPSPLLSACITSSTYLIVTIRISDQKISDRMPSTSTVLTALSLNSARLALNAYSGLVPISP